VGNSLDGGDLAATIPVLVAGLTWLRGILLILNLEAGYLDKNPIPSRRRHSPS
jgi:hypothetical protein